MGRGKGPKKPKDEFDDLDEIFKAEAQAADETRLREIISKNAVNLEIFADQAKKDPDVASTKDAAKEAMRPYADGIKFCRKRVRFCRQVLNGRGRPLAGTDEGDETQRITTEVTIAGRTFKVGGTDEVVKAVKAIVRDVKKE